MPRDMIVWLNRHAREVIADETLLRSKLETGGALFGFEEKSDIVVACAFGPGPDAKHGSRSFEPSPRTTAMLIDEVWKSSEGRYKFLGSWHSHPGGSTHPSETDKSTANELAEQPGLLLPNPIVVIQSTTHTRSRTQLSDVAVWRLESHRSVAEMKMIIEELDSPPCPSIDLRRRSRVQKKAK